MPKHSSGAAQLDGSEGANCSLVPELGNRLCARAWQPRGSGVAGLTCTWQVHQEVIGHRQVAWALQASMASRRRCLQLAQQHALARAFSVRSSQLASTLEALATPPAATARPGGTVTPPSASRWWGWLAFLKPTHMLLTINCKEGLGACVQKMWLTLGLGFAAAGLATVPTKAACAPAMATDAPVRPVAGGSPGASESTALAQLTQSWRPRSPSTWLAHRFPLRS